MRFLYMQTCVLFTCVGPSFCLHASMCGMFTVWGGAMEGHGVVGKKPKNLNYNKKRADARFLKNDVDCSIVLQYPNPTHFPDYMIFQTLNPTFQTI